MPLLLFLARMSPADAVAGAAQGPGARLLQGYVAGQVSAAEGEGVCGGEERAGQTVVYAGFSSRFPCLFR